MMINTSTGALTIGFHKDSFISTEENVRQFSSRCSDAQTLKIKTIMDDRLDADPILFGIEEEIEANFNAFFARHSSHKMEFTADYV